MKFVKQVFNLLLLTGFIVLQFVVLLDDPHHLSEPDQDCILCLAAQTPMYFTQDNTTEFNLDIIFFLCDKPTLSPTTNFYTCKQCIRAPPQSNSI